MVHRGNNDGFVGMQQGPQARRPHWVMQGRMGRMGTRTTAMPDLVKEKWQKASSKHASTGDRRL